MFKVGNFHLVLLWLIIFYLNSYNAAKLDHVGFYEPFSHLLVKRQTYSCAKTQFTCKSHECIEDSMLCDGVKDCKDGSDETLNECRTVTCPGYSFRCAYGACIDSKLKCDGRSDCADNSDETHIECPINTLTIINKCKSNEWKCKSGNCIMEDSLCDGIKDCDDGSDETILQCENSQCPRFKFRCNYGACIDATAKCNDIQECPDGSDEVNCSPVTTKPTPKPTHKPPPTITTSAHPHKGGICEVPYSQESSIVITDDNDNRLQIPAGSKAPKSSRLEITCKAGYVLSTKEKVQQVFCVSKEGWIPSIKPCIRTCPILNPVNVELSCHYEGSSVDCSNQLVAGTRVRPRCKPLHHEAKEVYYRELKCQDNGEWDNTLYKCVPDCGVPAAQGLIYQGNETTSGDSPWHVAIYRLSINYTLICGGTLISTNIVVSAAHCFFDEAQGRAVNSTSDYEIVVSKYTRNYRKTDNVSQKVYKVQEIIFTDKGFNPTLTGHYGSDIIVIVLKETVMVNKFVLPACVAWSASSPFEPGEGIPGKLVGWGVDKVVNAGNTGSDRLLAAELPYISYNKCLGKLQHITSDKFCAGSDSGPGARKGDSGGGLVFRDPNNGRYYLRGIVSTADKDTTSSVATFTDISYHLDWLEQVRKKVETDLLRATTSVGLKSGSVTSRIAVSRKG